MADGQAAPLRGVAAHPLAQLRLGWRRRVPVVLQTEAAECALACLAMIACYHGHEVDLTALRRRFSTSLRGANLARLMRDAHALGFVTRPLRLELEELGQLKTPCIVHWDLNHFVVLERVGTRQVIVHDPARGTRRMSLSDVSRHFTGVALELEPGVDFRPVKEKQRISLRALTGSVRGLPAALLQILGLALALEVFALVGPFYLQWVLDHVLVSADRNMLTMLGIGFLGVIVFRALITAARSWSVTWLSATLNVQWASNLFTHMLRLPLKWFESRHVGDVVSRFGSMQTIQRTVTTQFIGSLLDGLMSSLTMVVLCLYSIPLSLLVAGAFVLYALLRWVFYRPLYQATEDHIVYAAHQQSELMESVRGVMPIKLGNTQGERGSRYANATVKTVNRYIGIQRLNIFVAAFNQVLFGVSRVAIIWIAAVMVLDGKFTVGMMVAFVAFADQFHTRGAGLIDHLLEFSMLGLHAERMADIALSEPETEQAAMCNAVAADASIEVRNLSFRYAHGESWILKHCSFRVEAGESLAIIGPSGCGKTTLVKLILGLLQQEEGEILFGGTDIRKLGIQGYRRQVGAVMQDDHLFAGTLADNIAFFDTRASQPRVEAAARLAAIHEDIAAMPMGYQTHVGDMGSSLSGGQKQRVIVARAMYRRPKLLVLDEATSHLDAEHEQRVNAAVQRLKLTRIVIAHRPATIGNADKILALAGGQARFVDLRKQCSTEAETGRHGHSR